MEELPITVDENNFEAGTYEILKKIRPSWSRDSITFKVSNPGIVISGFRKEVYGLLNRVVKSCGWKMLRDYE